MEHLEAGYFELLVDGALHYPDPGPDEFLDEEQLFFGLREFGAKLYFPIAKFLGAVLATLGGLYGGNESFVFFYLRLQLDLFGFEFFLDRGIFPGGKRRPR